MKKINVRMLAEAGAMIALALVLHMIKIFRMPQGGSVTLGSMVPILLFGIRWGKGWGGIVGCVFGLLNFILGNESVFHPLSFILDFLVPFALVGFFAGMFNNKGIKGIFLGTFLGFLGRFISHVLSGAIVFYEYAGNQNPWIYSIVYNGTYLLPELVISFILVVLLKNYIPYFKNK